MRNFLVFSLVALCAVMMSSETAMAGGNSGGGGGGKGGSGKNKTAKLTVTNVDPGSDVYVYVHTTGTDFPGTVGALKGEAKLLQKGGAPKVWDLKTGNYDIYVADPTDPLFGLAGNTPIPPAGPLPFPSAGINMSGVDRTATVKIGTVTVNP